MLNTSEDHEQELLRRIAKGNEQAFNEVFNRFQPGLFMLAYQLLDSQAEAEDVTADTFIKFWNARLRFTSTGEMASWLRTTVRNASLDILKHRKVISRKQEEILAQGGDVFSVEEVYAELLQAIYHEIEQLPQKNREVFRLRYIEGLSNEEIALQLGISNQSVRDHLARALKALRLVFMQKKNLFSFFLFFINTK